MVRFVIGRAALPERKAIPSLSPPDQVKRSSGGIPRGKRRYIPIVAMPRNRAVELAKNAVWSLLPVQWRFIRRGKWLLSHGERELQQLPYLVERGTVALDIGANEGRYTYALTQVVGSKGRVISIEPVRELARLVEISAQRLGLPVQVLNVALSSESGVSSLFIPRHAGESVTGYASLHERSAYSFEQADAVERREVEIQTLDQVCSGIRERISFIKIDVEGHELPVLKGGVETLTRHRPRMVIEIEQRHSPTPILDTFEYLKNLGFRGEFLDSFGRTRDIADFDLVANQSAHLNAVEPASYINNFIFHPL